MDLQFIEIPVGALDTASDPTQLPPGGLTQADNCSADTPGVYEHRKGYTALASVSTLIRLAVAGDVLLGVTGLDGLVTGYDAVTSSWNSRGAYVSLANTAQDIISANSNVDAVRMTVGVANGLKVDAWIDSANGIYISVTNVATGMRIKTQFMGSFVGAAIRAATAGTGVYVVFSGAAAQIIQASYVDCATATIGAATTLFSGANVDVTQALFDLCPLNATEVVLVWKPNSATLRAAKITASAHTVVANQQIAAEAPDGPIAAFCETANFGSALYHSTTGGGMRACCFNASTMVQTVAPFTVEAVTAPLAVNCALITDAGGGVMGVWDRAASGATKGYVQWRKWTSAGALSASQGPIRNVLLASKAARVVLGTASMVNLYQKSTLQETFFSVQLTPLGGYTFHAMHAYRSAYNAASVTGVLSDFATLSAGVFVWNGALGYKTLASGTANAAVASFTVDVGAANRCSSEQARSQALFAGGICSRSDGYCVLEQNFVVYPEILSATPGAVGAAGMDNGTYSYAAVFEAIDTTGTTERSTPSVAVAATTTAGAGLGKVTLVLDQLHITRITNSLSLGVTGKLSIFRTIAGGTTYRYVTSTAISQATATVTIVDQAHDSTILSNRVLYTDGGVLAREPPPSALQLLLHKNRVWGISAADPRVLFYSGEIALGEGVWFSGVQQVRVEAGGPIRAIDSMDDKLIIYKDDRVFKMYGSGANALGQNSDLSPPILINSDAGAADSRSVVAMADGTMYRNRKGIQLLVRGEEAAYIGMPVETYVDASTNVLAANLLADAREIRFELDTGKKVVYNYSTKRWTTHSNYLGRSAIDAVVVGGVYYWADSTGVVYKESATSWLDPASTFAPMTIEWAWQALTGRQGIFRCQKLLLLAERMDPHDLTITTSVNNDSVTAPLVSTLTNATLATLPREQIRVSLTSQKVQSVRVKVVDAGTGATVTGQGYRLRGLGFMAGAKKGAFDKRMVDAAKV